MEGLIKLAVLIGLILLGWTIGRRNERRHLRDLASREDELRDILIFATRYPPLDQGTLDPCMVSGSAVVAADHFKMFAASLRKFVGGGFAAYEILIDRARRQAVLRMKEQAKAVGCKMIFNVRVETTRITVNREGVGTAMEVFAYGTALALARGAVDDSAFHHVPGPDLPVAAGSESFDLTGHPSTRWALILWAGLILWSFLQLFVLQTYWYADTAPWAAFLLVALAVFAFGSIAFIRRQVPRGVAIGLALIIGLTLPPILFFPALRVNALTDFSPAVPIHYRLAEDLSLVPDDPGNPVLRMTDYSDYFRAQKVGTEYPIVMRRGLFGFWQMERSSLSWKFRAYYRRR